MKNTNTYCLADKSKLKVGDKVLCQGLVHTITFIDKGGCVGEQIHTATHYLSNAVLFTKDPNRI